MAGRPVVTAGFRAPDIGERVENWKRFYERRNPRKLLGFFYGSEFPVRRYRAAACLPDDRALRPEDFPVEAYLDDNDRLFAEMEECPGDFIFSASAYWGIPWLEAALACPIRANHATGSLYAESPTDFHGPDSIPRFDPRSPWAEKLADFLEKAALRSAGRYPLATTRMRGIADLLSILYGGEKLIFAMMENPEEIHAAVGLLADLYIEFGKLQLRGIPAFRGGLGSFYYHAWAPAGTVWHQEDSVMLLSPELYRDFILPGDERIFGAFAGNIMHFHSVGGYIPVDEVLSLSPLAVEMHIDSGGPSAQELFDTHRRILDSSPLIIWGELSGEDFEWIFSNLPDGGVAINAVAKSAEHARSLWNEFGEPRG
jgi:hypothetical protein